MSVSVPQHFQGIYSRAKLVRLRASLVVCLKKVRPAVTPLSLQADLRVSESTHNTTAAAMKLRKEHGGDECALWRGSHLPLCVCVRV